MKELVQKIITLKVNGKDYDITVGPSGPYRLKDRMRSGSLRLLYRDHGRKGSYVMHDIDYGL